MGLQAGEEKTIPVMAEALGRFRGPALLHSGGEDLLPALPLLKDLPNLAGFVLNPGEDLQAARSACGPRHLLAGNLDGPNPSRVSAQAMREQAQDLLDSPNSVQRFLLSTSAADVPPYTPPENIRALRQAVEAAVVIST